jgi:hypothetical protein
MAMDKNGNGTSTLPDTLGTIPGALTRLGASPSVESRGQVARKEIPALFQEGAEAEAKSKMDAFDRDQGVLRKTADAERDVARGTRMAGQKLETGLQKRGVFEAPQYTASDYAKNSATRMITAVLLGGIAKTSAMGQLKAIESMQKAEQQGLADQFDAARLQFDEQEKQRQDNNKMLKDRFDRMIDLLGKDRNAALVEAKLIEGNLGKGIIAAELRAGNYSKAYDLFQKAAEASDRIAVERVKQAAKPPKIEQLPAGLEKSLEKVGNTNIALARADQTRKPEFFGIAPSDAIADLIVSGVEKGLPVGEVMRGLGFDAPKVTSEAVEWWKDYQSFVAQVRNQLFGATLTPREAADFRKFNVGPATAPDVAEDYFNRQKAIIRRAVNRERAKGRARGVSQETLSAFLDIPQDEDDGQAPSAGGGPRPPSFATEADLDAAVARGEIEDGDEVIVKGVKGKYRKENPDGI